LVVSSILTAPSQKIPEKQAQNERFAGIFACRDGFRNYRRFPHVSAGPVERRLSAVKRAVDLLAFAVMLGG
jgi:hypothetical protein